jgi:hypothetical protein
MFEVLKARNRQGRPQFAVIVLPLRLFRTFGAGKRVLTQALHCWDGPRRDRVRDRTAEIIRLQTSVAFSRPFQGLRLVCFPSQR